MFDIVLWSNHTIGITDYVYVFCFLFCIYCSVVYLSFWFFFFFSVIFSDYKRRLLFSLLSVSVLRLIQSRSSVSHIKDFSSRCKCYLWSQKTEGRERYLWDWDWFSLYTQSATQSEPDYEPESLTTKRYYSFFHFY